MRDKKFHELIEKQDEESKRQSWEKLKARIESLDQQETISESYNNGDTIVLGKRNRNRKIIIISFLVILAIVFSIGLYFILSRGGDEVDPPGLEAPPQDDVRYNYAADEYSIRETEKTLKDFSAEHDNKILFFNWYDETELCATSVGELNTTSSIICYVETIVDPNLGYSIQLGVTDNKTQVEHFKFYEKCNQETQINNVNVKWMGNLFSGYATFEFEGYCYYVEAQDLEKAEDILEYVRELLPEQV